MTAGEELERAYLGHARQYFDDVAVLSERTEHVWTLRDGKLLRNQPYREAGAALRAVGVES